MDQFWLALRQAPSVKKYTRRITTKADHQNNPTQHENDPPSVKLGIIFVATLDNTY